MIIFNAAWIAALHLISLFIYFVSLFLRSNLLLLEYSISVEGKTFT